MQKMAELEAESVDMVLADSPYEISNSTGGMMNNQGRVYIEQVNSMGMCKSNFNVASFLNITERLFKKGHYNLVSFCSNSQIASYLNWAILKKYSYGLLVWHKTNPAPLCNNKYLNDLEYIVYIKGKKSRIYGNYYSKSMLYSSKVNKLDKRKCEHPTVKPLPLILKLVGNHTEKGNTILDPFTGSGTTGVACVKTGRSFIGIEKELKYIRISNARINHAKKSRGLLNYMEETNG